MEGRGLFGGEPCALRLLPAPEDTGVVFVRTDLDAAAEIRCEPAALAGGEHRRTCLQNGAARVATVEHVLAAAKGMGVDNLRIEVGGPEIPSPDGSAQAFVEAIQRAGVVPQDADAPAYLIDRPVTVSRGASSITALPGPRDRLDIVFDLEYAETPSIGRQTMAFCLGRDDFAAEIAPARTFLLKQEAEAFLAQGLGGHLTACDLLVMDDDGPMDAALRFPDEHVRHKICDLIGDLAVLGRRLCGRIIASRSGHELNHSLVRRLLEIADGPGPAAGKPQPVLDIRGIMRLLPHRYPFLMVDRILETEGDERAVGIKNVTINEPYFLGHYPTQPIMPGVMILEAMAQMSGILLSRRLEHAGKAAVLLSMDRVKMRRPVRPGDQLVLEAEALRVRPRTGHCACRALVAGEVVAEAEIKFMLVDAEP